MSRKADQYGKTTANFRIDPKDWELFTNLTLNQHGYGGISVVLTSLIKEYNQKNDGKTTSMDSFLDPNFTPKPIAFDDLEKVVSPYVMQLSETELHRFRIWAFQTHTICSAYAKLSPQRRKVTKMSYEQCLETIKRFENGI